ncbi:MAG: TolC family outer membrane protein [Devosiaceae bacterium]|nr:TolC family outer membrane protein [Devosiaceae bacterium MH13]
MLFAASRARQFLPVAAACVGLLTFGTVAPAYSETLAGALVRAYQTNPELNAARAGLRVTDEGVPQALAGYRPTVTGDASTGVNITRTRPDGRPNSTTTTYPTTLGLTVVQPLFRGFQTRNSVAQAEASVQAGRAQLLNTEQNIFVSAAQAYMDVLADRSILTLRQQNVSFLEEQVRAAQARFDVGEGTRTDIAQANARRAFALAQVSAARAALTTSNAIYRQVIGTDPSTLVTPSPFTQGMPRTLRAALDLALSTHPAIEAARANVDVAQSAAAVAEGALLPTLDLQGRAQRTWDQGGSDGPNDSFSATLQLNVPIYQGGRASSQVRQSIELVGQRRLELDVTREQVRASVLSAFGGFESARAQIESSELEVAASQVALAGVIEEQRVGQRTTLDVLDTQEDLINARITEVNARRDLVVASYSLASSIGRLTAESLGLRVARYEPAEHYEAVRDAWHGLRTPDGRGGPLFTRN